MSSQPRVPDINVALIGFGLGGRAFHAPLIDATPGLRLTTIVTSNTERRAAAEKLYPHARIVDSADFIWAHAQEHQLVVITTANRAHVPLARAAIASRIAVVIDKPMARTANEARELIAAAERVHVPLSVYHNRRWDGEFLTARALIESGALGSVVRFESRLDRWRPARPPDAWRERGAAEEAGGLLYDLGTHLIDQALMLFGPVARVYAELDRRRPDVEVDDDVFISLEHVSGTRSHLWASSLAAQPGARIRVLGTRAAYTKVEADVQELALRNGARPDEPDFGRDPQEHFGLLGIGTDARPVETKRGAYLRFYEQIPAWLRDGAPPPVDPKDAVAVLEIIEAAASCSKPAQHLSRV
jgi:predicted dehydrogenase